MKELTMNEVQEVSGGLPKFLLRGATIIWSTFTSAKNSGAIKCFINGFNEA